MSYLTYKSDETGTEEDLEQNPTHLAKSEGVASEQDKRCQESEVKYQNYRHKLDEVLRHLLQTRQQHSEVRM